MAQHLPLQVAARVFDSTSRYPLGIGLIGMTSNSGAILGPVLLAVAAWRARCVSWVPAAVILVGLVVVVVFMAHTLLVGGVGLGLVFVGLALLGARVLRAPATPNRRPGARHEDHRSPPPDRHRSPPCGRRPAPARARRTGPGPRAPAARRSATHSGPSPPARPSSAPAWRTGSSAGSPCRRAGSPAAQQHSPKLTGREIEILDLLARGLSNHAISVRLYLSDKTARNHVSNILAKTGAPDRHAAADMARRAGLGGQPST